MTEQKGSRKKKIILLSNLFPNPADEGRGIFTLQIALRLRDLCDISVICPMPFFPSWQILRGFRQWHLFSQIPGQYSIQGIRVLSPKYLMIPKISDIAHAVLMFFPLFNALRRLKKAGDVDLVNVHWLYPDGVAASWACRRLKIPFVLTALGCDVNSYAQKPVIGKMIKAAVRKCAALTTVSIDLEEKVRKWHVYNGIMSSIPNGVDLSLFEPYRKDFCREKLDLPHNAKIILFVGRLTLEKGFNYLIDAIEILVDRGESGILVVVVGDGPLRDAYEHQVKFRGLTPFFAFKGSRSYDEIPFWMAASDLLCLPSLREGCPNVALEALGTGRPVVASEVGGVPEIVNDGQNGFTVVPRDGTSLAKHLQSALGRCWNPDIVRSSVSERSWERAAQAYDEVYRLVLFSS